MFKISALMIAIVATMFVALGHRANAGSVVPHAREESRADAASRAARPAIIENGNNVIVYPYPGISAAGPFNPGAVAFAPDGHAYINASYTLGDNNGYDAKGIIAFSPDGTYSFVPAAHVGYAAADIIYARGSIWSTTYNGIAAVDPNGRGTRYYYLGINFNKIFNAVSSVALGSDGAIYGLVPITNSLFLPIGTSKLFRIAANGAITSFAVPTVPTTHLVLAGDRHLYFSYVDSTSGAFGIARIEQNGSTTLFPTKNAGSCAANACGNQALVWSTSGYLYFATYNGASTKTYFGRMTTSGVTTLLPLPAAFEGGFPSFSADQGGNLWSITSVNNGADGLYQYDVYTGKIAGPFAGPELVLGSIAPVVGPDDNIWFIPNGYGVGPLGLAAYVREVQTLVPASLSVTVTQSKSFTILETNFKGPWTAQSSSPVIASVTPASSSSGVFTVTGVSHGATRILVKDRLGNISYESISSN